MSQKIPFSPYIFLVKKTKTPCHYFWKCDLRAQTCIQQFSIKIYFLVPVLHVVKLLLQNPLSIQDKNLNTEIQVVKENF